ncbi:MAG TPA: hypothetical protein PKH44_10950 [Plasticicumulans sp.]|nr:hypothetical protein [Plasticicumulans sp.]
MSMLAIIGLLPPSATVAVFAEWRARRIGAGTARRKAAEPWQRSGSLFFSHD